VATPEFYTKAIKQEQIALKKEYRIMKKTIKTMAVALMAMVMGFTAFAGENWQQFSGAGLTAPGKMTVKVEGSDDRVYSNSLGINANYVAVHKSGFSFLLSGTTSIASNNQDLVSSFNEKYNYNLSKNFTGMLGLGFTPVKTSSFMLSVYGTAGIDIWDFETDSKSEIANGDIYKAKHMETLIAPMAGGNIIGMYSPVEGFGITLSCAVHYVFPDSLETRDEFTAKFKDTESKFNTMGTVKVTPSIGVMFAID